MNDRIHHGDPFLVEKITIFSSFFCVSSRATKRTHTHTHKKERRYSKWNPLKIRHRQQFITLSLPIHFSYFSFNSFRLLLILFSFFFFLLPSTAAPIHHHTGRLLIFLAALSRFLTDSTRAPSRPRLGAGRKNPMKKYDETR